MIEAGTFLQDRYRVQKQIGQGGMGAVYIATDERFGSVVAIKETLVMESNFRKAIEREARLLNSLKHPALPRVSDHFIDDNGQYIVMEYIAGDDLSEKLEKQGKAFPLADVLNWAEQLLDALDFLHNQEIPVIHRDIKPQNLKLTPRGQIILLDFGLAKGNPTDVSHQTAAKSIFGYSRSYASLEQIQGTGTDPRSDIYSLAATLYHLVTGIPPEDALTRAMHVLSEKEDTLRPADEVSSQVSPGFAGVLQLAMALNANNRPQSAKEMREMLGESEKYAVENRAKTAAGNVLKTDLLSKETQLMGATNVQKTPAKSELNTQILPVDASLLTDVRTFNGENENKATQLYTTAETPVKSAKRGKALAASLGGLLLAGSAAAGVYFYNPQLFGANTNSKQVNESNSVYSISVNSNTNSGIENSNASIVETGNNSVTNDATAKEKTVQNNEKTISQPTIKTEMTGKNGKSAPTSENEPKYPTGKEKITIEGETIRIGNMTITDNGIETPDQIIDDNGVHLKNPKNLKRPKTPQTPVISPEQFKVMTPEQIQQLKNLRKNRVLQQNSPPKPPDN